MGEPAAVEDVIELDDPVDDIDEDNLDDTGGDPPDDSVIDEDPESSDDVDDTDPPAQKKGGVQKRIDRLTAARNKAQEDAAYWKGVADGKASSPAAPVEEKEEPLDRDDFDSEEEYINAVMDKRDKAKAKAEGIPSAKDRVANLQAQYDKGRAKHEDFDEVALEPTLLISASMFEAAQGDSLPDILYHLGKDPALAQRISVMPPMQTAKEIAKIESKLTANPGKKPKKTSSAPAPVPKVKPGGPVPAIPAEGTKKANFKKWEEARVKRLKGEG